MSFPKPLRGAYAAERKAKQRQHKDAERSIMSAVKAEDGHRCRYPRCTEGPIECAHMRHRGMGGNRALDRTVPDGLISLCRRHHALLDRGDLEIIPLTNRQWRGPCAYYLDGVLMAQETTQRMSVTRGA